MVGFIYIISNEINDKLYIGQTRKPINIRFANHKMASRSEDTKLYRAMRKYGEEKFHISLLETVELELLNEREIYWIKYYNSYYNGYNSTLGGDGVARINYDLVQKLWNNGLTVKEISEKLNCSRDACSKILKYNLQISENEIKIRSNEKRRTLDNNTIISLWDQGLTPNQITKQYGGTLSANTKVLFDYGITKEKIQHRANENQRKLTNDQVLSLWNQGKSLHQIEMESGSNNVTIRKQIHELGITDEEVAKRRKETCNQNAKKVYQYDLNGKFLNEYDSALQAGKSLGHSSGSSIGACCNHKPKAKTAYGFRWEFYKVDQLT